MFHIHLIILNAEYVFKIYRIWVFFMTKNVIYLSVLFAWERQLLKFTIILSLCLDVLKISRFWFGIWLKTKSAHIARGKVGLIIWDGVVMNVHLFIAFNVYNPIQLIKNVLSVMIWNNNIYPIILVTVVENL